MLWTVDVKTKLSIVACISYGNNFARKLYPKLVVFEQLANFIRGVVFGTPCVRIKYVVAYQLWIE